MKRFQVVALLIIIALITASVQAAFLMEIDTDGLDNGVLTYSPNFSFGGDTTAAYESAACTAPGMTGGDSIFGGNGSTLPDTYVYTYTPSVNADNFASELPGGDAGTYRVYAAWPYSTNIHADAGNTRYTISTAGAADVIVEINQNSKGNDWILLGDIVSSDSGSPITVTQQPTGANMYVSMRAAGMKWEAVSGPIPDPPTLMERLSLFTEQWLDEGLPYPPEPGSADFNGDGRVDFKDFAILANNGIRIDGSGEYRCIWVDIWGVASITTPSRCDALLQLCRDYNINTIIPEIRVYGDAYYQSSLEPRGHLLANDGFDPLAYLIDKAHDTSGSKKRIEVHAWFVMQRSTSSSVPLDDQHVLSQHFEYVMRDSSGNTGSDWYLDPGHPGALDHNVAVILDCLQNYDIDGINLDYIRYPGSAWGYNPVSVARFNAFYGKSGQPLLSDPDWSDWRRECTTHQVKKVYVKSLMIDPDVVVTTDTINWGSSYSESNYTSSSAYASNFQDWVGWLQEGIIDYNALMNYVRDGNNARYRGWTDLSLANDDKRGSIIGIGAYMQTSVQDSMDQLLYARNQGAAGLNIYDWGGEVNANTIGETANDFYRELKAQVCPEWVDPPVRMWKVRPTKGIFEGYLTEDGFSVDHGTVEIEGQPETRVNTDGTGWYAILEIPPGEYRLRFSKPGYADVVTAPTILTAGQIITLDADL